MKAASPKEQAEKALECRKIRLFIATHPGCTRQEIFAGTGIGKCQSRLYKMVDMGIVKFTSVKEADGKIPQRWYVIPQ